MLSQFGQKKKKEALRRLSQNAARRQSLENKNLKRHIMQGPGRRNPALRKSKRRLSEMESTASGTLGNVTKKLFTSEGSRDVGDAKGTSVFEGSVDSLSSFPQFGSSSGSFSKSTVLFASSFQSDTVTRSEVKPATPIPTTVSFGFPVMATSAPVFGTTASGLPVSSTVSQTTLPFFGTKSITNTGLPVSSVTKRSSGFPVSSVSQANIGFPVPPVIQTTLVPIFGSTSTTSSGSVSQTITGFPVPPVIQTTSVPIFGSTSTTTSGFPVSSPPKFSFLVSSDKNTDNKPLGTSIGFPVTPVGSIPKSSAVFGSGVSNTSFSLVIKDQSNAVSSVGFPIVPVSSAPRTLSTSGDSAKTVGFTKDSREHKKSPLKQSQPFGNTSNVFGKTFGKSDITKQVVTTSPEDKTTTVTDVSTLKSLIIREIPIDYNKNAWLRRFYSRFGEVVKVQCNPPKASATVVFKTHEAAKLAKVKGRVLQKGLNPVSIFWRQERKRTTSSSKDVQELAREKLKEPVKETVKERSTVKEPISSQDVQSLPLAVTTGDRFKVLEMIDVKLREGLTKESDITVAKAVKGACSDMCPEKERYMREDRRRLHVFEIVPGTGSMEENPLVDHANAIKEYDRSAADKEEPLPHALRPIPTLKMTMDYLVTNIMDIGEGRWADWFDFLWNRTRAIRKDITQQHLCDVGSVDLIEKTARFHIFCSHYLCDQDFGVFDPRINAENLTKCLQTLKHFYDDLKDQNILCPCEAEFRAYDILLNLNEGDILRQVTTYREEIRASPIVKFTIDVFHALNSNNFVRFFRLLRYSNYLCSCLLHRYFTQIRQQALRILNYSLSVANKEMTYSLSDLGHMLAFDDENEVAMFCRFHELTVHEPYVLFIRGSFVQPETAFPSSRSLQFIESKRTCLIGEVVYNGPLPPKPNHNPTLSFDESGQYIGCNHILPSSPDDKATRISPAIQFKGFEPKQTQEFHGFGQQQLKQQIEQPLKASKPPVQINIEELKEVTRALFNEVINELVLGITDEMLVKVHQLLRLSDEIATEIEKQSVSELLQETAENVILDEQRQQLMQAQQALFRERASSSLVSDIVHEVVEEETCIVASSIYSAEQRKIVQKSKEIATEQIGQELLEETVREETGYLVLSCYKEMKAQRKSALQQIAQTFLRSCTRRYFMKWVKSYHSLVRLKKLLSDFPAYSPLTSAEVLLSNLIGPRYEEGTSSLHTTRIFEDEQNIAEILINRQKELDRIRSEVLRPVDIPSLLANTSGLKTPNDVMTSSRMDWKLLISLPGPCPELGRSSIDKYRVHVCPSLIKEKFKKGTIGHENKIPASLSRKVELLALYSCEAPSTLAVRRRCHVCTMACYGVLANNEVTELLSTRRFQGTSAIVVVLEADELQTYSRRQEVRTRVQRLVESKPDIPTIPAAILLLESHVTRNHVTQETIIDAIGARNLSSHLSEVTITRLSTSTDRQTLDNVIQGTISWLARRSQNQLQLECDTLKNFIESGLQRYFFTALYDDVATRKKARIGDQCPEAIVDLYNNVIEHLASVASSTSLCRVSWPITEFRKIGKNELPAVDWNSEASLSSLNSVILSLCLPLPPPGVEDGKWESEALLCHKYCRQIPQSSVSLSQRVSFILENKHRSLQAIDFLSTPPQLGAAEVPWTQVMEACISSVMTSLHSDPVLSPMEVFYLEEEMEQFTQPEIWREAVLSSKQKSAVELEKRARLNVPVKTRDELIRESVAMIDQDLDKILNNKKVQALQKRSHTSSLEHSFIALKTKLGTALKEARSDVTRFEKDLQGWLPEYFPKKRKAELHDEDKNPLLKSCRFIVQQDTASLSS